MFKAVTMLLTIGLVGPVLAQASDDTGLPLAETPAALAQWQTDPDLEPAVTPMSDEEMRQAIIEGALEPPAAIQRPVPGNLIEHSQRFNDAVESEYPDAEQRLRDAMDKANRRKQDSSLEFESERRDFLNQMRRGEIPEL